MKALEKNFAAHITVLLVECLLVCGVIYFALGEVGVILAIGLPLVCILGWMLQEAKNRLEITASIAQCVLAGVLAYYFVWVGDGITASVTAVCMVVIAYAVIKFSTAAIISGTAAFIAAVVGADLAFIIMGDAIPTEEMWTEFICPAAYLILMGLLFYKNSATITNT